MNKTILLIEDNPDVAAIIRLELETAGFEVLTCFDGVSGLTLARERPPDLVLLDLMLPDMEGAEVARRLRIKSKFPIVVVSAIDKPEQKIALFDAGIDDYITKPFLPQELLARVKARLRHGACGEMVQVGELQLFTQRRSCSFQGQELKLSPREFDLLTLLARRPDVVHSRGEIERSVWGEEGSTSNVVDVHLANIRSKLRALGGYGVIRTARGVGYAINSEHARPAARAET